MSDRDDEIGTAALSLGNYFRTLFDAADLPWSSDNEAEVQGIVSAIVAETIKKINLDELAVLKIDIVRAIENLFKASGAQTFSDILREIRHKCSGVADLEVAEREINAALDYLLRTNVIAREQHDFGYIYGYPSDL